jgi:aspartyl-tRNA(Asn)/glutamyl-tRNA(Gln) amidotransferase subunit A
VTTCGSRFYAKKNDMALQDSAVAARLREAGAIIMGKTHLHQLAYGITGENSDYGDCRQPLRPERLTGGSSSGAAASVQEGSALAGIGTDTGGSIRTPAALCGVAGYRASHGLADRLGLWKGGVHLAQSFDTLGWLFKNLSDGPQLAEALFGLKPSSVAKPARIGVVSSSFLHDCDADVLEMFAGCLAQMKDTGAQLGEFDAMCWNDAQEIFVSIQASESAAIHAGNFAQFEPAVRERLEWGASLSSAEIERMRKKHDAFRVRMDQLFAQFDFVMLPCAPMAALIAGADNSSVRMRILRYTAAGSLGGNPIVALPGGSGGVQLMAARGDDARLLAWTADFTAAF